MPIGRPATVNTLWVPGGISATGAMTYLCMARAPSHVLTRAPLSRNRGAIAFYATRGQADNLLHNTSRLGGVGLRTLLFRAGQISIEGEGVAVQVIEGEFARSPRGILNGVGSALDPTLPILIEERVRVLNQKPQANAAHFVLELKLHVELDRVTTKSDIIWRIGVVLKGQLEAKLLGVE